MGSMMTFRHVLFFIALLLAQVFALGKDWCTGEFTCETADLFEQQQGYHSEAECQKLCEADGRCSAYTLWKLTALNHWNQCWLFTQCVQTDCVQCVSGKTGDDCVDPDTTTTVTDTTTHVPDTTVPGQSCPALPESGGSLTCFPEVLPGEEVPDGAHCIFSCGDTTSAHTCAGGSWDVPPPSGCFCPALPAGEGVFLCVPSLEDSGETVDGTFCIFSCDGHPVMEVNCEEGAWDTDDSEITCSLR